MLSNENNQQEISTAIFGGLIGLAAVFFTIREFIEPINISYYISLIIIFLLVALVRVFGTILEFERLNRYVLDVFSIFVTPFTVFVMIRIFITQVIPLPPTQINVLPFILAIITFAYIIERKFKLDFKFSIKRKPKI